MTGHDDRRDAVRDKGKALLASAFGASRTPTVVTDPHRPGNPIVWANDAFLALTGCGRHEVEGRSYRMLQADPAARGRIAEAMAGRRPIEVELRDGGEDGSRLRNGTAYFFAEPAGIPGERDTGGPPPCPDAEIERLVGERTSALQAALDEKTALLHEIDHRVKNNLQVISSLMLLKARRTPQGEARDALQTMAERVGALSSVHRMLYAAGDTTRFNIKSFADEFLGDLVAGVDPARTAVSAQFDEVAVSAAMAAPLALLVHELATNAIRHAFPENREGRVSISARRDGNALRIRIEDNGIGLSAGVPNPAGFGRSLAEMVVRQLRGTIAWTETSPGTLVAITVPLDGVKLKGV